MGEREKHVVVERADLIRRMHLGVDGPYVAEQNQRLVDEVAPEVEQRPAAGGRRVPGPERTAQIETRTGPERPAARRPAPCEPSGSRSPSGGSGRRTADVPALGEQHGLPRGRRHPARTACRRRRPGRAGAPAARARCAWRPGVEMATASAPAAASSSSESNVARPGNCSANARPSLRRGRDDAEELALRRAREQRRVEVPSAEPVPSQTDAHSVHRSNVVHRTVKAGGAAMIATHRGRGFSNVFRMNDIGVLVRRGGGARARRLREPARRASSARLGRAGRDPAGRGRARVRHHDDDTVHHADLSVFRDGPPR